MGERRDIAVGIPDAHQLVRPRHRVGRLLWWHLGVLLGLSCVENTRQTLLCCGGNMRLPPNIQIIAQPCGISRMGGLRNRGVP